MAVFSLNEVKSLQVKNKDTNFASWPEDLSKTNFAENYVFLGVLFRSLGCVSGGVYL